MAQSKFAYKKGSYESLPPIIEDLTDNADIIDFYQKYLSGKDKTLSKCREYRTLFLRSRQKSTIKCNFEKLATKVIGKCERNNYTLKGKNKTVLFQNWLGAMGESEMNAKEFYEAMLADEIIPCETKAEIDKALRKVAKIPGRLYKIDLESENIVQALVDLNNVDNPLRTYRVNHEVECPGINKATLLIGPAFTISSIHVEDWDFPSINLLLAGEKGKLWIIIHPADNGKFENAMRKYATEEDKECYFLRNKMHSITIEFLERNDIRYVIQVQEVGDMLIVGANVYHMVLNLSRTIASAINFVAANDIEKIYDYTPCTHDPITENPKPCERMHGQDLTEQFPDLHREINIFLVDRIARKSTPLEMYKMLSDQLTQSSSRSNGDCLNEAQQAEVDEFLGVEVENGKCLKCFKQFSENTKAARHFKEVHLGKKRELVKEKCELCKYEGIRCNLKKHLEKVHGIVNSKRKTPDNV